MTPNKRPIHFLDPALTECVHPIPVNLIGVGGTGSHVLEQLSKINDTMLSLGHPGLLVRAFDEDTVSRFNLGRQRFIKSEIGQAKAAALINRINRWSGTYWQSILYPFSLANEHRLQEFLSAPLTISCVDTVQSRFEIEQLLTQKAASQHRTDRERPTYWMDFGNTRFSGQVILSTVRRVSQPSSKKYLPVDALPMFTQEYRQSLLQREDKSEPSCSTQEALAKQDLFINPTLAVWGCRLLWQLFSDGLIEYRGLFVNTANYKTVPIPITVP